MLRVCDNNHFPICYDDIRTPDVRCPICEMLAKKEQEDNTLIEQLRGEIQDNDDDCNGAYINELQEEIEVLKEKLKEIKENVKSTLANC